MKSPTKRLWQPLLGYSTNVHRGETLAQVYRHLKNYTVPVARRLFGKDPSGLELHISMSCGRELRSARLRREFGHFLQEQGLYLFSVNAYPLKSFHTRRVKEQVYSPSWTQATRYRWTNIIADILADLLPEGTNGSVSTLGGVYRPNEHGAATYRKLARNYLYTVEKLASIEQRCGKTIVLAVEPEPETTLETAADVVDFFERYLWPAARSLWRPRGLSPGRIDGRLRKYFTVNFDTCHFSVLFEDPVASLHRLRRAGIGVGKVHVTNAIRLPNPLRSKMAYKDFRDMHEPRYLHQFRGADKEGNVVWRGVDLDRLPRQLQGSGHDDVAELRSHYHVPLYLKTFRRLRTTQDETLRALRAVRRERTTRHVVIETYTWPLIRREEALLGGIVREYRWLLSKI